MSNPWWTYSRIDNFGTQDPQGTYWKPDSNIQIPGGYPVTNLLPGTITNLQTTGFGQSIVTMRLDNPLNSLATHQFYEHLANFAPGLAVGQHVSTGQLLGNNNPSGIAPLGYGFYPGDTFGAGSGWAVLQKDLAPGGAGMLNPVPILNAAQSGSNIPTSLPGGTIIGGGGGGITGGIGGITAAAISTVLGGIFSPFTSVLSQLAPLWAWMSNPARVIKFVAGTLLIVLGLYMMFDPQAISKATGAVKDAAKVAIMA